MIDQTLKELWDIKDNIAKEHDFDLDDLATYLQLKSQSRHGDVFKYIRRREAEIGDQAVDSRLRV